MARRPTRSTESPPGETRSVAQRILTDYLEEIRATRSTGSGVPETSYYPALASLFNAVGATLKPMVRCVIHTRNRGAGIPDGGLFTADQFAQRANQSPKDGQLPSRGAIEAKASEADLTVVMNGPQVRRYLGEYRIVLITNLRDFLILERGPDGRPAAREAYSLAPDEARFWSAVVAHPRAAADRHGERFGEFVKRACLHAAPLSKPRDVAWFLASYARDGLARVEEHKDLPALRQIRTALEDALGMKFTQERGEHFFRSTLVQTLFYGVFSAWALWCRSPRAPSERFEWRAAGWSLHVPFIRTLYEAVATAGRLGPLGLVDVLDWSAGVLNRVDSAEFFKSFEQDSAVQYFYEPFLEAYDPQLRKDLGVWYTPPEIVQYQVARVDAVLREELGVQRGLADPDVIVLDPCCGTGAYLVEVLRRIEATLRQERSDALIAADVKRAAMERVFGFEILPAPFVISHLQLGLLLRTAGAGLDHEQGERVGVYLTNALTGWEPPIGVKATLPLPYPELAEERDAAERVKRATKILVILGNPPYNAFAGVSPEEEQGLVEPYKRDLNTPLSAGGWGIKKFNLDDLYVRFFRVAERRIAEMTGRGIVSFISNFSYLGDPSFVVMRRRLLSEFDKLWFDCMNGDSRQTGKLTPDGAPDPSVFSTEYNREGIRVGTAVCVIVRKGERSKVPQVALRHFWGVSKRAMLLDSLTSKRPASRYTRAKPRRENRFAFRPENVAEHYDEWPAVAELCAVAPFNGPVERRGCSLISIDHKPLEARIRAYFDSGVPDTVVAQLHPSLLMTGNRIVGPEARRKLLREHTFDKRHIVRYPFKPLDRRWAYLANIRPLFSEPSPHLLAQVFDGNSFLISRDTADKTPEGPPFLYSRLVCDYDSISGHARHFPVLLRNGSRLEKSAEATLFDALGGKPQVDRPVANLSGPARRYLAGVGIANPDSPSKAARLWLHVLAVGYSPAFLAENADGIRRDWPRVPLPANRAAFEASALLGQRVADVLDTEATEEGAADREVRRLSVGSISKKGRAQIDQAKGELKVTAGWGYVQKNKSTGAEAVFPGAGRLEVRAFDADELAAIDAEAEARNMKPADLIRLLGGQTCDVFLNQDVCWRNVPLAVWNYYIGGYQVVKKWLSYREHKLLGRPLSPEEAREVSAMVRRLTAVVLLGPALDENYRTVKANAYGWPRA